MLRDYIDHRLTPLSRHRCSTGYVSAQYRFLVKPTGDYTAYFADADIYLNWGDILSVLIPTSSALSGASTSTLPASSQPSLETHEGAACPICLSPPTAPRMTKCGHVFCYPCILQYLSTIDGPPSSGSAPIPGAPASASVTSGNALTGPTNRQWKRCPICWDAVYARDLKAVKWWDPKAIARNHDEHHDEDIVGQFEDGPETTPSSQASPASPADHLCMRLIERPQITTLALPASSTWPTSSTSASDQPLIAQHQAPWHFQPDVMSFCKFMLATPQLLLESLTQDVDELTAEKKLLQSYGAVGGDDTLAYVDLAERKVQEQMAKVINELDTPAVRSAIGQAKNDLQEHEEAEKSKIMRDNENMSRRRKRQLEREQQLRQARQAEEAAQAAEQASGEDVTSDEKADATKETESVEGAEAFLALRANQGGAYTPSQPRKKDTAPSPPASLVEEQPELPKGHQNRPRRNLNPPAPGSSSYLFYQAASGQNIFLHPLDIKVLHSHFGSYAQFPRDIAVKVQGAEEGSMNEELRKRCKYLTHLPKGTDVVFIEVDWDSMAAQQSASSTETDPKQGAGAQQKPLIDKVSLKPYEQILRARRNKRRDRERKEDRAKLKAEEADAAARPGRAGTNAASAQQARGGNNAHFGARSFGSEVSHTSSVGQYAHDQSATGDGGVSPSFMEAALWGAERDFPIHPGHAAEEDFPAAMTPTPQAGASSSPTRSPATGPTTRAPPSSDRPSKTVWGTPAARSSFSSTLHASSRGGAEGDWDDDVDDAWLELEEGFVLGTNNSKKVTASRGINTQQPRGATNSTGRSPPGSSKAGQQQSSDSSTARSNGTAAAAATPPAATSGKKQKKAKLVLTSGGRGTA